MKITLMVDPAPVMTVRVDLLGENMLGEQVKAKKKNYLLNDKKARPEAAAERPYSSCRISGNVVENR